MQLSTQRKTFWTTCKRLRQIWAIRMVAQSFRITLLYIQLRLPTCSRHHLQTRSEYGLIRIHCSGRYRSYPPGSAHPHL